ncbi:MAG: DNA mismatch repair endonuclease MutL [Pseudomonadota bacterium]
MSGKIVILPEALTHKIAAGEVIERPASIVKELLENALDAGATDVRIELLKGGCGMIRITDNGEGFAPADVPIAFERYATSKIYEFDDIYKVGTFGFRGEALPSIAAIARVEMTTRLKGALSGTSVAVTAGRIEEIMDAGCPEGTTITVTRIFDPVPVRKKFLKTDATEQGYCMDVVTRTALAHPHVRIQVMANGREVLKIPATVDLSERMALILGLDVMDQLLPVQAATDNTRLQGFISRPPFTRSHAKHLYSFVNRRYIRDYLLNHAVMTAYRNLIEPRRYPAAVLLLDLLPQDVDVNVHPAKLEVRFRHPREIYSMIVETLAQALAQLSTVPESGRYLEPADPRRAVDYRDRVEDALKRYRLPSSREKLSFPEAIRQGRQELFSAPAHRDVGEISAEGACEPADTFKFGNLDYLGQVARTYLVFSAPERIVVLDQHAAHERVLFEKFRKNRGGPGIVQRLLIPEVMTLSPKDMVLFEELLPVLEEAGIEAESFGGHSVVIRSIPVICSGLDARTMILDLLESLSGSDRFPGFEDRQDKIFSLLACKAAIKANQSMTPPEAAALCRDLDETPFAATCPHGRPVYIVLGLGELEKRFKRT